MRHLIRRWFLLLAAGSLALLVIVVSFWVRGYLVGDRLERLTVVAVSPAGEVKRQRLWVFGSAGGRFALARYDDTAAAVGPSVYDGTPSKFEWTRRSPAGAFTPTPPDAPWWRRAGFSHVDTHMPMPNGGGLSVLGFAVPAWFVALPLLPLPAIAAARVRRRRVTHRRVARGLCPTCGYDLRGSSNRCPECGTTSATLSVPFDQ